MSELKNSYLKFKLEYNKTVHSSYDYYDAVSDIFDALFGGSVRDNDRLPGHGVDYYSESSNIYVEILANIGALYNAGRLDFLRQYLPKEFVDACIIGYEKTVMAAIKNREPRY